MNKRTITFTTQILNGRIGAHRDMQSKQTNRARPALLRLEFPCQGLPHDDGEGAWGIWGVSSGCTDLTLPLLFLTNPFILSCMYLTLIFLAYLGGRGAGGVLARRACFSHTAERWNPSVERTDAGR